jgi:hypothetical protein
MTAQHDLPLTITVTDRTSMEHQLEAAVSVARERAMHERSRGILVTRHAVDRFSVALSDAVPFGITHELQAW